jgi:hypothetical protein
MLAGAVGLQGPDLHLAEALAAELGLAAQRLLGDQAVRAGAPGVDLVLHQVVELEHVDVADGDVPVERLAGAAVAELDLAVLGQRLLLAVDHVAGLAELGPDLLLGRPVEDRGRGHLALGVESPAEVRLEDLADVHPARHAERVEDDVDGRPVRQERHVLGRQDLGDDALVAVAAGHLVADRDLALLGHRDPDQAIDAGLEVVVQLAPELADLDDLAALAVGQAQRAVLHLARLLTEDRAEEALLRGQLGLALGRDLADEDVAGADLGADVDDALLVEVLEGLLADVRDVARDLLGAELRVARLDLVLLDVDAGEQVVADEAVADDDRVLVVAALPAHERHEDVPAERELARVGRGAVGDRLAAVDPLADVDDRALVDARCPGCCGRTSGAVLVELARSRLDLDPLRGHRDDTPSRLATTTWPESRAARSSMPVPTIGASGSRSGTAWRCMFEPMRARFASSCSRNGMSAVATETTCFGAHVHVLDLVRTGLRELVPEARRDALVDEVAVLRRGVALACATTCSSSSSAGGTRSGRSRPADREGVELLLLQLRDGLGVQRLALLEDDGAALGHEVRRRPRRPSTRRRPRRPCA